MTPAGLGPARARRPALALMTLAAAGSLGITSVLVFAAARVGRTAPCSDPPARVGQIPPLVIIGLAVAAFASGRLAGRLRDPGWSRPTLGASGSRRIPWVIVVQAVLTGFLTLVAALLGFETYALTVKGFWPITFYVRCANDVAPLPTLAGTLTICFLLGHWLWYPWSPEQERRAEAIARDRPR